MNTTAKLPILKQGEYDMWRLRIKQYFQVQDYALWDVIENGNSFKPVAQTTTNADGTSTSLIPDLVTTEEKAQKKNDVKARSIFGGNEATKKTQKTLLKQMYENFSALSTESLDSIFNRLQKIISQLAILGENISQEDLNLKFLRSLPSGWNTHVMVWRNKPDLDTMSFDDLYNNFKIVKQETAEEFQQPEFDGYRPKISKSVSEDISNEVMKSPDALLVKELVSNDKPKEVNTARPNTAVVNAVKENQVNAVKALACNMSYLLDFKAFDGGYVTFRGGAKRGRITGKGTLKTGTNSNDFAGKKDDEVGIDNQERPEKSTHDVNTARPIINTASTNDNTGSLNINTGSPIVTTALTETTHAYYFEDEIELDMSNISTTYPISFTPNTRIHKDHSLDNVIGDVQSSVQTRRMTKTTNDQGFNSAVYEGKTHEDLHTCLFACFLSQEEPKRISKALSDSAWVEAMQKELLLNKKYERGIVIRNKARLVAHGYTQEEGIDYDEVFAPIARIKAIRLFLFYASFMGFMVYQMDVKIAFLYGQIEEEVYVCQPPGFEDPDNPNKVYKVVKALYGLHQAPRACSMGELTFFLGLQVKQKEDVIFISQDKYVADILRKFGFTDVRTASTPMDTEKPLLKDLDGDDVDVHLYRSMIRSLMYLTSSRPDIMFAVCACARFQVTPKVSHSHAVKRIFRYLKGQPKFGLWYPRDSPFDLVAYSDSDYAGASLDRKSTTGGSGYQQKDRKPSQNDKTEHGMEKTVQNQGQSPKMPKSESILKNTVGCNLNPSDGPGKPNSIFMKTVKTKWALNQFQQPICVQLTKTVKTLKTQS
ncbi:putative ribonuclease H-like domain-containing protein [Tanacetum coccineum]|uniref:Ribonuclease H-like domain-containing protein n=1 Tax=Tanacetum coccineum TaxID=301880 RepID=A0ABQ5B7U9_9ASTR